MTAEHLTGLRQLWQEAFGNSPAFTELFFYLGFSPDRYHCILENDTPVSALYWFDCTLNSRKLAYVYGVATLKSHRGQGFARRLMAQTHEILRSRGYSGVILVPEEAGLFRFYEKIGYRTATTVTEFTCEPADTPLHLRQIDAAEYARLREAFLPEGGVILSGQILDFLQGFCKLYAGEDFLLAGEFADNCFVAQEFLGNAHSAPGIVKALGSAKGNFRAPGKDRNFAMFLPLAEGCPTPTYFAPPMD